MKNKLPIKYEEGFFRKIKKFFGNIFKKSVVAEKQPEVIKEDKKEINNNGTEFVKMKLASNKIKIKEDILTLIEKNPSLIETLSIGKLKELEKMYNEIIEKNDRKIKQLKREIA